MSVPSAADTQTGLIASPQVQSISVAGDGSVWAADMQGGILESTENVQPWLDVPGQADWVSVSASANLVCAVMDGGASVLDLTGGGVWKPLGTPGSDLKMVSVGLSAAPGGFNAVWAVDTSRQVWTYRFPDAGWHQPGLTADAIAATSDGAVYRLDGGVLTSLLWGQGWVTIPTAEPPASIAAGAEDWIWFVGASGEIYQYDGSGGWIKIQPPANDPGARLACGEDTTTWLVSGGSLYAFDAASLGWNAIKSPPNLAQASISTQAQAFAVDTSGGIHRYTEHLPQFQPVAIQGLPAAAQVAAATAGRLYAIDASKDVWTAQSDGTWSAKSLGEQLAWVSAAADGSVWGINAQGAAYELVQGAWQWRSAQPVLQRLSVAAAGVLAAVDAAGGAWEWSAADSRWAAVPGTNDPFVSIAILPAGMMLAIGKSGQKYVWLQKWIAGGGKPLAAIAAGGDDEVWGIDTGGYAVEVSASADMLEPGQAQSPIDMPQWDTENPFDEAQSTHLWIVNRGAQLAQAEGAVGQQLAQLVKPFQGRIGDPFHDALCQGLYDADFKAEYNQPILGQPTYESHFYDPDTGLNWRGGTSPTALTQGRKFFTKAVSDYRYGKLTAAGYLLGLSLHYLTDLTQPMHAANYTYLSSGPRWGYHTAFEGYIMEIQNTVTAPSVYVASTLGTQPDPYFIAAARNSKSKYYSNICTNWSRYYYWSFTSYYEQLAKQNINGMLTDAIRITSQYLIAWMQAASTSMSDSRQADAAFEVAGHSRAG